MRVFVVGASGFIGRQLVIFLRGQGLDVVTCGRSHSDVYMDLLYSASVVRLAEHVSPGDVIVLLGGMSQPDQCELDKELADLVNRKNTCQLCEAVMQIGANVLFASTDGVYGNTGGKCDENTAKNPFGYYSALKSVVEETFSGEPKFKSFRLSYVLGKGDRFSNMLNAQAKAKVISVYSGFSRRIVVVDDVLVALGKMVKDWGIVQGNCVNMCGPELVERQKIVALYQEYVDEAVQYRVEAAPHQFWESRVRTIDMSSLYFTNLLGRAAMSVRAKFQNWN